MAKKISRRIAVIKVMTKPKMPSEIHEEALEGAVSLSNTTEILDGLIKEGLVVCINENEKVGRLYALTRKGGTVRKKTFGSESSFHELPAEIIDDYTWVMRGKHRRAVIKVIDGRKTPSQIHRDVAKSCENIPVTSIHYVKLSLNSTSDTLRGFRKKGIAVCANPERRVKRLYELTKKGKEIREQILKE
ncbi:hypothetical protein ES702_00951 [subsurface metagenome]